MSSSPRLHLCDHLQFQKLLDERNQLAREVARLRRNIDACNLVLQVANETAARELAEVQAELALLKLELGDSQKPETDPDTLPFPAEDTLRGMPIGLFVEVS